ncbi:hypothetical protein CF386_12525 [Paraphotobacterium marinum]|uniref:Uncharacterized protein n=1 Tax=Paraphotobacterium marinum TaxID=1755811 RepID=A0A220VHX5_9GAMM|nr:hypothetical protein [Paraphotobacterium marinum]ASK79856.1 hypothetical protein CF386_12525 [Paraphotobacterium marinum]
MKIQKKLILIPLMGLACSAAHAKPVWWGTATEKACVLFTQPTTEALDIHFSQSIKDTSIKTTLTQDAHVKANFTGKVCAPAPISHDINGYGEVLSSWEIKHDDKVRSSLSTASTFWGNGARNDWDIDEKGKCGLDFTPGGVYLSAPGHASTCGKLANVEDEDTVIATYVFDSSNQPNPPEPGIPRYNHDDVNSGKQVFKTGDKAYGEYNAILYECKNGKLCSQDPNSFAPGTGSVWREAWKEDFVG